MANSGSSSTALWVVTAVFLLGFHSCDQELDTNKLKYEISSSSSKVRELERSLEKLQGEARKLKQEIKQLRGTEVSELQGKVDKLKREVEQHQHSELPSYR